MAAASSSQLPDSGESDSSEEPDDSLELQSVVSSSVLDSDEESGVGCESRDASDAEQLSDEDDAQSDAASAEPKDDARETQPQHDRVAGGCLLVAACRARVA